MKSRPQSLKPLLLLAALSLVCLLMAASPPVSWPQPRHRSLYLSAEANEPASEIQVAARTSSTLRFDLPPTPSRAVLGGWADRFEPPLVGGGSVVIFPLHALSPKDRVPLTVTLADGTVLPFTLVPAQETVDTQVDVFLHMESVHALRQTLKEERAEKEKLQAENLRHQQESLSTEHALATLILNKALLESAYKKTQRWTSQEPSLAADIDLLLPNIAPGYAAAVFTITNNESEQPWTLGEVRLTNKVTGQRKPCAVRMRSPSIAPGQTGQVVIVTSLSQRQDELFLLEVFRKNGLRDFAFVDLSLY
jgi:uncharacterized protein (TIGR02268 family)